MSRCDLDLWLLDLEILQPSNVTCLNTVQIFLAKSINPRPSYWRLITVLPYNFRGGIFSGRFLRVRGPNFTELVGDTERSSMLTKFVLEFWYFAAFSNAGIAQIWVMSKIPPNLPLLTPLPSVKSRKGWARSLGQLMNLYYLRPNLRNTFDGRWEPRIDKKERKQRKFIRV